MYNYTIRKSIRKYSDKNVDDILLNKLLADACHTQTMGNLQLYSVVVTRDKAMKEALSPAHFNQPMVKNAPVVLTFCADYNRCSTWCEQRKAKPGYNNFLSFLNAATDTLLFCQTFCNMAEEKGLGLCFLGTTIYNSKQIIDTLKLPKLVMPIATITLGWPDEDAQVSDRLPLEAIVHSETYHTYTSQDIDNYYSNKENLPENKRFVEINNVESLAQIFTDIRYKADDCKSMSVSLIDTLKHQGFM